MEPVEEAYEFCLAYAAQGRRGNEAGEGSEIRGFLERARAALNGLPDAAAADAPDDPALQAFVEVLRGDAAKASAAIRLVLARPAISSQLVDNLNASIHLRALLTGPVRRRRPSPVPARHQRGRTSSRSAADPLEGRRGPQHHQRLPPEM